MGKLSEPDGKRSLEASPACPGEEAEPVECFRCGICCMRYQVPLSLVEAKRIADYLGLSLEVFLDRCADHRWYGPESLLRQLDGACVFLDYDENSRVNNCRIHAVKPNACRDWTPDLHRRACQEGLAKYWQLSVSPSGRIEGPADRLEEFRAFLELQQTAGGTHVNTGT